MENKLISNIENYIKDYDIANAETYLVFKQGEEKYALGVSLIREFFFKVDIYPVPLVPEYINGVINLRGNIVPVLDLSMLLYEKPIEVGEYSSILVVEMEKMEENVVLGVIVDCVSEVINVNNAEINLTPDFGIKIDLKYISGIVEIANEYIILLNAEELFNTKRLANYSLNNLS